MVFIRAFSLGRDEVSYNDASWKNGRVEKVTLTGKKKKSVPGQRREKLFRFFDLTILSYLKSSLLGRHIPGRCQKKWNVQWRISCTHIFMQGHDIEKINRSGVGMILMMMTHGARCFLTDLFSIGDAFWTCYFDVLFFCNISCKKKHNFWGDRFQADWFLSMHKT